MKQLLSIAFLSLMLTSATLAQITIRRADFTVSGVTLDSGRYRVLSKTTLNGQVAIGNNQTWDFSTALDSTSVAPSKYYFIPASLFGAAPANLNDANLAYNYNSQFQVFSFPSRTFQKVDSTGYYEIGYATNGAKFPLLAFTGGATDTIYFPALSTRYNRPRQFQKFPMTANAVWNNLNDREVTAEFQLSIAGFGLNRVPGQRVTIYNFRDTVVGWGTLRLRNPSGGAALNFAVLLQRSNFTLVDSFYVGGAPAPAALLNAFALTQGATYTDNTVFSFRAVGFNEPVASVYVSANGPSGGLNYYRAVNNAQGLSTATREYDNTPIATKAYPNPTSSDITLAFDKTNDATWNVMVYNLAGQVITVQPISSGKGAINQTVSLGGNLTDGTYFYNLVDENSLIRANGQFKLVK